MYKYMKKKKTLSKLKKELDKWFSLYIRLRRATKEGVVQCFTCGKIDHYKKMHCGHFQSRKHHATRWHDKNCEVQCVKCNIFDSGQQYKFSIAIDSRHGQGTAQELEYLARTTVKFMRCDYEELIEKYKRLATLLINKTDKG